MNSTTAFTLQRPVGTSSHLHIITGSKAPKYVVLAGEGTFDYKDNQGHGGNLIPPIMIGTPEGLFPSDNHFADIDGDHIPEMAIGRLPVVTSEELMDVIKKIMAYGTPTEASGQNKFLCLLIILMMVGISL